MVLLEYSRWMKNAKLKKRI